MDIVLWLYLSLTYSMISDSRSRLNAEVDRKYVRSFNLNSRDCACCPGICNHSHCGLSAGCACAHWGGKWWPVWVSKAAFFEHFHSFQCTSGLPTSQTWSFQCLPCTGKHHTGLRNWRSRTVKRSLDLGTNLDLQQPLLALGPLILAHDAQANPLMKHSVWSLF